MPRTRKHKTKKNAPKWSSKRKFRRISVKNWKKVSKKVFNNVKIVSNILIFLFSNNISIPHLNAPNFAYHNFRTRYLWYFNLINKVFYNSVNYACTNLRIIHVKSNKMNLILWNSIFNHLQNLKQLRIVFTMNPIQSNNVLR